MRSLILNCCLWQNKLWKGTEGIVCCVWCLIFLNHCVSVMVACVHWTNCWKANGEIDENGPLSYEQHQSAMFHFSWTDPLGHFRSDSVVFETALDCQHVHNQQESVMHNYCFSEFVEECDWQADEVVLEVFGRSRRCPLGFGSCWHCANAVVVFVLWALFVDRLSDFTVFVVWHLSSREEFLQFAEKLGEQQTPSWLGLPNNAEKVLLTILGKTSPIVVMYCYCRTEVFSCCDESCGVLLVILRMLYEVIMGEYLLNAVELVPKCSLLFVISTFEAFQHRLDLLYLVMTSPCALPFRSPFHPFIMLYCHYSFCGEQALYLSDFSYLSFYWFFLFHILNAGSEMVNKLLKMQLLEDDDDLAYAPMADSGKEEKEVDGRPAWMKTLSNSLNTWSQMLPKVLLCLGLGLWIEMSFWQEAVVIAWCHLSDCSLLWNYSVHHLRIVECLWS